ncbi:MAG TPA: DUF3800 domain-containing protein [Candidatus Sulfotelmatobacter sp.]|nr:DUF3800 domain-containing protein [Candidatus Sulfotelmatobacter sp.]
MCRSAHMVDWSDIVVIKSYFDKSGQEDQDLFTIGAVAAADDVWDEIETEWNLILQKNNPPASYMHMVEAIPLRRGSEFCPSKGWNDDHVFGLINLLLSFLATPAPKDRYRYCHFSCSLRMNDYRKLRAETYQLDSPADMIASACVRKMSEWYFEHYQGLDYEAHYYFDQNEPFEEIIKAKWNRARLEQNPKYQWGHIAHIGSAMMRKTPGLQIADMIAWATNRHEVKIPQRYDNFVIGLRHLLPSFWVVIDEQQMRKHYRPLIYHPYENRPF